MTRNQICGSRSHTALAMVISPAPGISRAPSWPADEDLGGEKISNGSSPPKQAAGHPASGVEGPGAYGTTRGRCALMTGLLCSALAVWFPCRHISTVTYFSALDKFRSVPATRQEGVLARTHEGERGLPRGRNGLPPETVRAAQRERLLRSVIAAVAASGFSDATVADIVRGARVSKAAFYAHFADKEDCFLAATREGGRMLADRVAAAGRHAPAHPGAEAALRASIAAYLGFLAAEPAFARAFFIDMPAVGARAIQRLEAAQHSFARMTRKWHERARRENPSWPDVPYEAYLALAGATAELVRAEVRHDRRSEERRVGK